MSTPSTTHGGAILAIRGTTGTGRYATTPTMIGIGVATIRDIIRVTIRATTRAITPASILRDLLITAPAMVPTIRQQAREPREDLSITTTAMRVTMARVIRRLRQIATMEVLMVVTTVATKVL